LSLVQPLSESSGSIPSKRFVQIVPVSLHVGYTLQPANHDQYTAKMAIYTIEPHSFGFFGFLLGGGLGWVVFYTTLKIFDSVIRPFCFPNLPPYFNQPQEQPAEIEDDDESDPVVIALQRSEL
jgi:hypothetical protein